MPTQRIHPDKYLPDYYVTMANAVKLGTVELYYITGGAAKIERQKFYGARAALRKHPEVNRELAHDSRYLAFKLAGSKLVITNKQTKGNGK